MKTKHLKIGSWVQIEDKGKLIMAAVVDLHKDGRITVSWSEQITVTGKPEDLKIRLQ